MAEKPPRQSWLRPLTGLLLRVLSGLIEGSSQISLIPVYSRRTGSWLPGCSQHSVRFWVCHAVGLGPCGFPSGPAELRSLVHS